MTSRRFSHLGGAALLAMGVVLMGGTMVAVAGWDQDDHGNGGGDDRVYVQSGDVTARSAAVWARCNREAPARLVVEVWEEDDEGEGTPAIRRGPQVSAETDYTGLVVLRQLRPDTDYAFRVGCVLEAEQGMRPVDRSPVGRFETAAAPRDADEVSFVWAADLAGQGWGRNPELGILSADGETVTGGYVIFDVMAELEPDFAVFAGDMIYADNPIPPTKPIPDEVGGGIWVNDPTKDFVAITLDEFRENWKYNLGDEKLRRFLLETPIYAQWDDHEVTNNWYPGEILTAAPYDGLPADTLAAAARQALFEYNPIRGSEIYRKVQHGRHMELFLLDERAYRGPNPANYDPAGIEMLGEAQFEWLKQGLKHSTATWKVVSTHDPLSIVTGGPDDRDAWGQGSPEVLGREVQLGQLLRFIKDEGIENVVFITADVHFAAAIAYDPATAVFEDFAPFWEFVIGPVHAGAFGANELDASFGPRFEYLRAPSTEGLPQNLPPPNLQSFGAAEIDADGRLTVRIHDVTGVVLYEKVLYPER